jgi:hypothetical protein
VALTNSRKLLSRLSASGVGTNDLRIPRLSCGMTTPERIWTIARLTLSIGKVIDL